MTLSKKPTEKEIEKIKKRIKSSMGQKALKDEFFDDPAVQASSLSSGYHKLGNLYTEVGQKKKATAAYKEALKWEELFIRSEFKNQPDIMEDMLSGLKKVQKGKKFVIELKEPDMEIGSNTLKLIIEALQTPKAYGFERITETVTVRFPKNFKIPKNLLKNIADDIERILRNKLPQKVLYPWVKDEYSEKWLRMAAEYIRKNKVKTSRKD